MNFLSNVLDSIPVVGHVKGVIHYAAGDTDGGNKAMYQSTRTSAVLAGGAVGCLAGPAGAALGGVYGGMITDGIVSVAKDEPVGLFESTTNIGKDIASGKAPLASIGSATFQIAMDGIGGFGMGGVTSAVGEKVVTKTVESTVKKAATTVGEEMIEKSVKITAEEMAKLVSKKTTEKVADKLLLQAAKEAQVILVSAHVGVSASKRTEEERLEEQEKQRKENEKQRKEKEKQEEQEKQRKEKEKREEQEKQRKGKEKREEREKHASPGGSQPPQGNKDNNKKSEEAEDELDDDAVFNKFKEILRRLLKKIYGNNTEPFTTIIGKLSRGQIGYLIKILRHIMPYGTLEAVIEVVITMFKKRFPGDISFTNILSLLEFVQTYLWAKVKVLITKQPTRPALKYRERRANAVRDVMNEDIVNILADLFKKLQDDIRNETSPPNDIFPDFRDLFSAAYHYFKHKLVPGDGELSIKQYYDYIRQLLKELKNSPEYDVVKQYLEKLKKRPQHRNDRDDELTITCEMYIVIFGRMFKIVVKIGYGTVVLSSAYVVKRKCVGVKDGTVIIKIVKKDDDQ